MRSALVTLLLLLGWCAAPAFASTPAKPDGAPEDVILLHGLGRTERAMRPLEKRLAAAGFRVHYLRYPSTDLQPEDGLLHRPRLPSLHHAVGGGGAIRDRVPATRPLRSA